MQKKVQVTVLGGGTGIYPVVSALKELKVDISTVVAASDSGGSTGRIRDEFGFPPVGDLRQSLAALAQEEDQEWIRKILLYRFTKGTGLVGHNLGNLILTALQDMTGSTTKALRIAEQVLRLEGDVIPVTEESVQLKITYSDGTEVIGEHTLDSKTTYSKKIDSVSLVPECSLNPAAATALKHSNLIIIGPGDYYASLLAVLVVQGMREAFEKTSAKILYILNLMTRNTQTTDMSAQAHVAGIEAAIGKKVSHILINSDDIPHDVLKRYAAEDEYPVVNDMTADPRIIFAPLLEEHLLEQSSVDTAHRSLLRHNQQKLKKVLERLVK